jgi:hypothetical protein
MREVYPALPGLASVLKHTMSSIGPHAPTSSTSWNPKPVVLTCARLPKDIILVIVLALEPLSQIRRSIMLYHASLITMSPVEVILSVCGNAV